MGTSLNHPTRAPNKTIPHKNRSTGVGRNRPHPHKSDAHKPTNGMRHRPHTHHTTHQVGSRADIRRHTNNTHSNSTQTNTHNKISLQTNRSNTNQNAQHNNKSHPTNNGSMVRPRSQQNDKNRRKAGRSNILSNKKAHQHTTVQQPLPKATEATNELQQLTKHLALTASKQEGSNVPNNDNTQIPRTTKARTLIDEAYNQLRQGIEQIMSIIHLKTDQ